MNINNEFNKITEKIIGTAIEVHKELGPGYVERVYERAILQELRKNRIQFESQKEFKVKYKGKDIGMQRLDLLIDDKVIVELKAVSEINEIHKAQMLSYLKATDKKIGLILNFAKGKLDIKRLVNNF